MGTEDIITTITIHGVIRKEECAVEASAYLLEIRIGETSLKKTLVVGYDFDPRISKIKPNQMQWMPKELSIYINIIYFIY
ncbi:MAG: hypothetical protein ACE5KT_09015 [Methanosarcinales archaeon]